MLESINIKLTLDDVFVFCIAVLYFSTSSKALFSLQMWYGQVIEKGSRYYMCVHACMVGTQEMNKY
jgi:hypothetical protein